MEHSFYTKAVTKMKLFADIRSNERYILKLLSFLKITIYNVMT